jgi:hypothetical protein
MAGFPPLPYIGAAPQRGYMPGAPAGFIMNPYLLPQYLPKSPVVAPAPAPVSAPSVTAPSESQNYQQEDISAPTPELAPAPMPQEGTPTPGEGPDYYFPWQMQEATQNYSNELARLAALEQETGIPQTPTITAPQPISNIVTNTLPDVNYKDIGTIALSAALGGAPGALYTAADKFILKDQLPGVTDILGGIGPGLGAVGNVIQELLGFNTTPTTTWDSTNTGLSVTLLPGSVNYNPEFKLPQLPPETQPQILSYSPQYLQNMLPTTDVIYQEWLKQNLEPLQPYAAPITGDSYGPSYEEPYTGWTDTTDYGYQTPELSWSPSEDVSSWSDALASAAEAEQWGG